jgi:hypothetical protein
MKKILSIVIVLCFITSAFSQGVKWGPRIGVSTSQVSPKQLIVKDQIGLDTFILELKNANYGLNAGLFLRLESKKAFFFQTELHFSTSTTEYGIDSLGSAAQNIVSETYYDLNLPVHVGMKFGVKLVKFRIQGGPILSKNLGGNTNINTIITDYKQAFNDLNVGWQAGIGLDVWKITFDVRYEGDFGKYANHMQFFGEDIAFDDRERLLKFSLGWKF